VSNINGLMNIKKYLNHVRKPLKKFTLRLLKLGWLKLLNFMMLKLHEQIMFV